MSGLRDLLLKIYFNIVAVDLAIDVKDVRIRRKMRIVLEEYKDYEYWTIKEDTMEIKKYNDE